MPAVPIVRTGWGKTQHDTLGVKVENEPMVSLITTPRGVTGTPGTWSNTETARPGLQPVSQPSAPGLRTAQFEHKIYSPNPYQSVEPLIQPLRAVAERGKRVQFYNGGMLLDGTRWLIRDVTITEDEKGRGNVTSRATISWDLVEANTVKAVELTKAKVKGRNTPIVPTSRG